MYTRFEFSASAARPCRAGSWVAEPRYTARTFPSGARTCNFDLYFTIFFLALFDPGEPRARLPHARTRRLYDNRKVTRARARVWFISLFIFLYLYKVIYTEVFITTSRDKRRTRGPELPSCGIQHIILYTEEACTKIKVIPVANRAVQS